MEDKKEKQAELLIEEIEHLLRSANFNLEIEIQIDNEKVSDSCNTNEMFINWIYDGAKHNAEAEEFHLYLSAYECDQDGGHVDTRCDKFSEVYSGEYLKDLQTFKSHVLMLLDELL